MRKNVGSKEDLISNLYQMDDMTVAIVHFLIFFQKKKLQNTTKGLKISKKKNALKIRGYSNTKKKWLF